MLKRMIAAVMTAGASEAARKSAGKAGNPAGGGEVETSQAGAGGGMGTAMKAYFGGKQGPLALMGAGHGQSKFGLAAQEMNKPEPLVRPPTQPLPPPIMEPAQRLGTGANGQLDAQGLAFLQTVYR